MKKLLLYVILTMFGVLSVFAESGTCKILYLIPFESASYTSPYVKECEDMDNVRSYQLMGFWNISTSWCAILPTMSGSCVV